jgi:DNA repair protein RadA/Sms
MSKKDSVYVCQECGAVFSKWSGKCSECHAWDTIQLETVSKNFSYTNNAGAVANFSRLSDNLNEVEEIRINSKIEELNRVLGGGLVRGSAILIGGDPGIGKSTLLLQLVGILAQNNVNCAYVTGEESLEQIRLRAQRMNLSTSPVNLLSATNINEIVTTISNLEQKFEILVVDSIQTMFSPDISSAPGTVSQVKAAAHELINLAKQHNIIVILVGHVTKEGQLAGPKILEHMVDTVLYFEGERENNFRILRAVKNRYGGINEIGVFEMSDSGLAEVPNPSILFLGERRGNTSGVTVFAGIEGTRPILVEVQALVAPSQMVAPRRAVVGWDLNRLSMIIAVLGVRFGLNLNSFEVYLNVVGGLRISEPAADLAVMCALISAMKNKPLVNNTIVFGEIGLSGEIRKVSRAEARIKEAVKLGFSNIIVPEGTNISKLEGINITVVSHVKQLQDLF